MLDGAYSVGELNQEIAEVLRLTYANEIWVHGEIASLKRSSNGHVYFQLVDSGPVDRSEPGIGSRPPEAVIPIVLFDSAKRAVNAALKQAGGAVRMSDGTRIRLRARLELYAPQGRVQLRMTGIDPSFTLALLQSERDRILTALSAEQLLDRNASRPIPRVIERIGLVTSDGSAAMADFIDELSSSGIGWRVVFAHAQVQGAEADRSMAAALTQLDRQQVDVIALVRGGGAKTDLASFDSELLGRTIAGLGTPVVTGIGHEIDTSVADAVAHTSLKTPTACAVHLVRHAMVTVAQVEEAWAAIRAAAVRQLDELDRDSRTTAARVSTLVRSRLALEQHGVLARTARLERDGKRALDHAEIHLAQSTRSLRRGGPRSLRTLDAALDLHESRLTILDPTRLLMRGWSITTREDGRVVRSIDDVRGGDSITTALADGSVTSTVAAAVPSVDSVPPGSAPGDGVVA